MNTRLRESQDYRRLEGLVESGDYPGAIDFCQGMIAQASSEDSPFWLLQSGLIHFLNETDDVAYYLAPEIIEQCVRLNPNSLSAHFWRGWMLAIIERKHEDARREFEHCLAIKPDHAYAHMALSGLSGDDRTEVKATHLKEVLKVQPNNARAQKEMAEIHLRAGEFEDAARLLKAVIENEPYLEDGCGIMNEYVNGVLTGALSSFVKDEARELLSRLPPL